MSFGSKGSEWPPFPSLLVGVQLVDRYEKLCQWMVEQVDLENSNEKDVTKDTQKSVPKSVRFASQAEFMEAARRREREKLKSEQPCITDAVSSRITTLPPASDEPNTNDDDSGFSEGSNHVYDQTDTFESFERNSETQTIPQTKVEENLLVIPEDTDCDHTLDILESDPEPIVVEKRHFSACISDFAGMEEPLQIEQYDFEIDLIDLTSPDEDPVTGVITSESAANDLSDLEPGIVISEQEDEVTSQIPVKDEIGPDLDIGSLAVTSLEPPNPQVKPEEPHATLPISSNRCPTSSQSPPIPLSPPPIPSQPSKKTQISPHPHPHLQHQ
jgi:hypothetical protein